jgi:hypothetical protein
LQDSCWLVRQTQCNTPTCSECAQKGSLSHGTLPHNMPMPKHNGQVEKEAANNTAAGYLEQRDTPACTAVPNCRNSNDKVGSNSSHQRGMQQQCCCCCCQPQDRCAGLVLDQREKSRATQTTWQFVAPATTAMHARAYKMHLAVCVGAHRIRHGSTRGHSHTRAGQRAAPATTPMHARTGRWLRTVCIDTVTLCVCVCQGTQYLPAM